MSRAVLVAFGVMSLWLLGVSAARAATLERLVMPGPLIEGHADLEDDCGKCHRAFVSAEQVPLCLDCHEAVRSDVESGAGFHGALYAAQPKELCKSCHTEHKGRSADIVGFNRDAFDHERTDFPLRGAHVGRACASCHEPDKAFRDASSACVDCHRQEEPHQGRLGDDCGVCHSVETPWQKVGYDHSQTEFPLDGAHRDVACKGCHVDEVWGGSPTACSACHRADDVHRGGRGDNCGKCHNSSVWKEARFDHLRETRFALRGRHAALVCSACHLDQMAIKDPPKDCVGCHSADDRHRGRFGTACGNCHGESDWKIEYDHARATGYALNGAHAPLACVRCHRGALEDELPKSCVGCHEDDDPHAGRYRECADCHSETTWHAVAFDHGFTQFPLIGIHASAACEACHTALDFTQVARQCRDCHEDRDAHDGAFGEACETCHNPNGWNRWRFDHDEQTTYPLVGSHRGLECASCHGSALPDGERLSRTCISCHRGDDKHDGRFGADCGRCHTTESFSDPALWHR